MPVRAKVTLGANPALALQTSARRGLAQAGRLILAASDAGAPREETPRHGYHMTETGFVRVEIDEEGGDRVAVGYTAYWALLQHEDLAYHHDSGHAKFLELALLENEAAAMEMIAAAVRESLGAA